MLKFFYFSVFVLLIFTKSSNLTKVEVPNSTDLNEEIVTEETLENVTELPLVADETEEVTSTPTPPFANTLPKQTTTSVTRIETTTPTSTNIELESTFVFPSQNFHGKSMLIPGTYMPISYLPPKFLKSGLPLAEEYIPYSYSFLPTQYLQVPEIKSGISQNYEHKKHNTPCPLCGKKSCGGICPSCGCDKSSLSNSYRSLDTVQTNTNAELFTAEELRKRRKNSLRVAKILRYPWSTEDRIKKGLRSARTFSWLFGSNPNGQTLDYRPLPGQPPAVSPALVQQWHQPQQLPLLQPQPSFQQQQPQQIAQRPVPLPLYPAQQQQPLPCPYAKAQGNYQW